MARTKSNNQIGILEVFTESFKLLKKEPKLFIPKMVVAILYGIAMFIEVQIFLEVIQISSGNVGATQLIRLNELLGIMVILFIYNLVIYVLDIFVNSLYPTLVKQLKKGKVSLSIAIKDSKKHFATMFASSTIPLAILFIITIPFSILIAIFKEYSIFIQLFVLFVVGYIFVMLFYFLYPIVILGKGSTKKSLNESIKMSLTNKKEIFYLSLVPFSVTILKAGTAVLAEDPTFLVLFVALVFLTGIIYTYYMVMNPYYYLKIKK